LNIELDKISWPMSVELTAYALELLAATQRKQKRALTSLQAGRTERRYQKPASAPERNLSKSIGRACDDFFRRRALGVRSGSWGFRDP
jgi:hypothetical protein